MRLRVVRLREIGDTLGEPATLYEAHVAASDAQESGPRMAFGPDRLLYLMLPYQMEFSGEPTASTPRASMLRLSDQGRTDGLEPLTSVTSSPLAFSWSRATGALVLMSRGSDGNAVVQARNRESVRLRAREGTGAAEGTLILHSREDLVVARALLGARVNSGDMARLAMPVKTAGGLSDRIGDVLAGDDGTLFLATQTAQPVGDQPLADVIRLTPVR